MQGWPEDCCVLAVSIGNLAARNTALAIATSGYVPLRSVELRALSNAGGRDVRSPPCFRAEAEDAEPGRAAGLNTGLVAYHAAALVHKHIPAE